MIRKQDDILLVQTAPIKKIREMTICNSFDDFTHLTSFPPIKIAQSILTKITRCKNDILDTLESPRTKILFSDLCLLPYVPLPQKHKENKGSLPKTSALAHP